MRENILLFVVVLLLVINLSACYYSQNQNENKKIKGKWVSVFFDSQGKILDTNLTPQYDTIHINEFGEVKIKRTFKGKVIYFYEKWIYEKQQKRMKIIDIADTNAVMYYNVSRISRDKMYMYFYGYDEEKDSKGKKVFIEYNRIIGNVQKSR